MAVIVPRSFRLLDELLGPETSDRRTPGTLRGEEPEQIGCSDSNGRLYKPPCCVSCVRFLVSLICLVELVWICTRHFFSPTRPVKPLAE